MHDKLLLKQGVEGGGEMRIRQIIKAAIIAVIAALIIIELFL